MTRTPNQETSPGNRGLGEPQRQVQVLHASAACALANLHFLNSQEPRGRILKNLNPSPPVWLHSTTFMSPWLNNSSLPLTCTNRVRLCHRPFCPQTVGKQVWVHGLHFESETRSLALPRLSKRAASHMVPLSSKAQKKKPFEDDWERGR